MSVRGAHVVVPDAIDDPRSVSGGNVYDRRLIDRLRARGVDVHEAQVPVGDDLALRSALDRAPAGSVVLIDGLVASRAPGAVEGASRRREVVLLAHMVSAALPSEDGDAVAGERRAVAAAHRVVATSPWTRDELVRRGLSDPAKVRVAVPGADAADPSVGTRRGRGLLSVGVVSAHKGQDLLVAALAGLRDLGGWTCTMAGSLETDAAFADTVVRATATLGLADRVALPGVLAAPALSAAYRTADLVVAPSRAESWGIAVTDALRRGIPVVVSSAGGLPDAVATSRGAAVLVPPDDPDALQGVLRRWMTDPRLRARARARALATRRRLPTWDDTAARVASALERLP